MEFRRNMYKKMNHLKNKTKLQDHKKDHGTTKSTITDIHEKMMYSKQK